MGLLDVIRSNSSFIVLYICAVVLGLSNLFAYNSFLSSPLYLERYYMYTSMKSLPEGTKVPAARYPNFWSSVSTVVTACMMCPMLIGQALMLTPFMLRLNLQIRMITGSVCLIICMLLLPVCSVGGGVSEQSSMAIIFLVALLAGFSTPLLQSSLFAFFGTMPSTYMGGFVLGGGFSGSVSSVIRIVIAVTQPPSFKGVKEGAIIFFVIGIALMVVTIAIVVLLRYNTTVQKYCEEYQLGDVPEENDRDNNSPQLTSGLAKGEPHHEEPERSYCKIDDAPSENREDVASQPISGVDEEQVEEKVKVWTVFRKIWLMMGCCGLAMLLTLTLFPGLGLKGLPFADSASNSSEDWSPEPIWPMVVILMYNIGDTLGRLLPNFKTLWIPRRWIPVLAISRIVVCVIPLALAVTPNKIINHRACPIVIMLMLGITNGYIIGTTMAYGSGDKRLLSEKERAAAGTCMCFSLLFGGTLGSIISLLVLNFAF